MTTELARALFEQMASEPMRLTPEGKDELLELCDRLDRAERELEAWHAKRSPSTTANTNATP